MTKSESQSCAPSSIREAPKFHYDLSFDLKGLQNALRNASFLQDSGYKSIISLHQEQPSTSTSAVEASEKPAPSCPLYGTGWMVAENLSDDGADAEDDAWGESVLGCRKIQRKFVIFIKIFLSYLPIFAGILNF